MKRAFIVHGWDGYPEEAWFPWLKRELEKNDFTVEILSMPDPAHPKIETWVPHLASAVGNPDADTFLIGHSIGVQTILRYLETIDREIGGVVAVAGFFDLIPSSIGGPEEEKLAEPWLTRPINLAKVKRNAGNIIAIFSDNDQFVALAEVAKFAIGLGAKTIVLNDKGHLGASDNTPIVPEILSAVLEISEK